LSTLVRAVLSDKKPEDVPKLIESLLSKVVEEFENRVTNQYELVSFLFLRLSLGSIG
jgi:kinesin family protein C2/C3